MSKNQSLTAENPPPYRKSDDPPTTLNEPRETEPRNPNSRSSYL